MSYQQHRLPRRTDGMDDSSLFMQWAVNTLQQEDPEAVAHDGGSENAFTSLPGLCDASASHAGSLVQEPTEAIESWAAGLDAAMDQQGGWSTSPNSGGPPEPRSISMGRGGPANNQPAMSWSFNAAAAACERGVPEMAPRRAARSSSSQGHIMAERKRRETMNQRFIELSTVIPGLKKMDKGTILTDAARYVKELEEKIKSLQASSSDRRMSIESVVLIAPDYQGSRPRPLFSAVGTPSSNQVPEIKATISENNVVVRIHCENGKGLAVRVLAEVEELHLRIVNSNVTPFSASTVIITAMAKLDEGFTINAEEIVGRLNSVLHNHS
ncbi:transcription factor bHLH19 [Brachypodium distachyon]|uniref:BHLH domain-containing protein n=1 Tax=Brachypodium distachyon TaxID=15368 RepID=A0A0Q3JPJ1_BRADI|nr:transcription factor bHLH19 [Brachypodium distachyon]KQK13836.1 hypothetical protein BRADI_1g12780v3 [Brachypodium distachyon]|eukprot:XP_003559602.2 transcription factor bHLH19 [Brachypodium distachyon]